MGRYRTGTSKAKNKITLDEKISKVMSSLNDDYRRLQAVSRGKEPGKVYTMREIAEIAGYARSTRFLLFLYELVDRGLLKKEEHSPRHGKGICDVNILFMLPQTHEATRRTLLGWHEGAKMFGKVKRG